MKRASLIALIISVSAIAYACGGAAENKPSVTVTNANTAAKPASEPPSKAALMALESKAWEAWKAKDGKYFEEYLADNAFSVSDKGKIPKAEIVKRISDPSCEVNSFSMSEDRMTALSADVALVTYKATQDAKCGGVTLPADVRVATVLVRKDEKWQAVYHGEVPIIDPKKPSNNTPASPVKKQDAVEPNSNTDESKPAADPVTTALITGEKAIWEAWKAHDLKTLEALTANDISFVNIFGTYFANKADALKDWTGEACNAQSVNMLDSARTSVSPTVSILSSTWTAEGSCGGQKIPSLPIYATSVYVKDGTSWKWAFGLNRMFY
ncbi:MAG: nuclear transport factor 2 family protein [Pyrinomonadaceae bacterium]